MLAQKLRQIDDGKRGGANLAIDLNFFGFQRTRTEDARPGIFEVHLRRVFDGLPARGCRRLLLEGLHGAAALGFL